MITQNEKSRGAFLCNFGVNEGEIDALDGIFAG
jgi:hypothetical protein